MDDIGSSRFEKREIDDVPVNEEDEDPDDVADRWGFLMPEPVDGEFTFQGRDEDYPDLWLEETRAGELRLKATYRKTRAELFSVLSDGSTGSGGRRAWFMPGRFKFCPACGEHHSDSTRDITLRDERFMHARNHIHRTGARQNAAQQDLFFVASRPSRIEPLREITPELPGLGRGVTLLHALRYRTPKPLAVGVPITAGCINDSVQPLVLGPCGDQFIAPVVETPVLGENAHLTRETAKHTGETEGGGGLEICSRAHRPVVSHGAMDLLNARDARVSSEQFLRAHKCLNYEPLPH